ncbi:glutaredoxin family protein [Arthrobacter sp. UYCu723]
MTKTITIYSRPDCQPCKQIKRWWKGKGVTFQEVDVEQHPENKASIKALGYDGVPVIVVSNGDPETDMHWQGLNMDFLIKYTLNEKAA